MLSTRSRLGSSELANVDRCERLHELRDVRRLVPIVQRSYQVLGSLVHLCLRYWYTARLAERPAWFEARTLADALHHEGVGYPKEVALAGQLFAYYLDTYAALEEATWAIRCVEHEWAVALARIDPPTRANRYPGAEIDDATEVTAQVDLQVATSDGVEWIWDLKNTQGQYGKLSQWRDGGDYQLDWQVLEYLTIVRAACPERQIGGFGIQRIKYTQPWETDRNLVTVPPLAYAETPALIRRQVRRRRELRERIARGEPSSPAWWACRTRSRCDYFDLCRSSNREHVLATQFRVVDAR